MNFEFHKNVRPRVVLLSRVMVGARFLALLCAYLYTGICLIWVSDLYFTILFVVRSDWVTNIKIFLFPFLVSRSLPRAVVVLFCFLNSYIYVRRTFVFGAFTIDLELGHLR